MNHRKTSPFYIPNGSKIYPTPHAQQRMAQRNLSWEDIHFVLMCGQRFHKAGAIFIFLGGRDIPDKLHADKRFSRLEGTAVVVSRDEPGCILTVYRNRQDGAGHIRRKLRRTSRNQREMYLYH